MKTIKAPHQIANIAKQIRGGQEKSICLCATIYKGGGNNSVTYLIELYELFK